MWLLTVGVLPVASSSEPSAIPCRKPARDNRSRRLPEDARGCARLVVILQNRCSRPVECRPDQSACAGSEATVAITDPSAALEEVERFIGLLVKDRELHEAEERGGYRSHQRDSSGQDERERVRSEILRLQPLIEAIGREIDPDEDPNRFKNRVLVSGMWGYSTALVAAERLTGILQQQERLEAILGPKGPVLAAGGLHEWVWHAAVDLWDSGHFKEAVRSAASAVEEQTCLKIDRRDLTGTSIFNEAFSLDPPEPGRPRLRFAHIEETAGSGQRSQEWKSAHEGAMAFGRGCFQGIRNLQAHGTADLQEQQALEYLAALSVLARWVDDAQTEKSRGS